MKFIRASVVCGLLCGAAWSQTQTVYLLPMSSGLDQYLASSLAKEGPFRVVTDPWKADAVLSDRVGESLEAKLKELYPALSFQGASRSMGSSLPRVESSWSRGRGNLFLVDRRTRGVLWSMYERPKNSSPGELHKLADRVVKRMKHDLAPTP
jgi:hypothetical protein